MTGDGVISRVAATSASAGLGDVDRWISARAFVGPLCSDRVVSTTVETTIAQPATAIQKALRYLYEPIPRMASSMFAKKPLSDGIFIWIGSIWLCLTAQEGPLLSREVQNCGLHHTGDALVLFSRAAGSSKLAGPQCLDQSVGRPAAASPSAIRCRSLVFLNGCRPK
jgi:hypothetical protein